MSQHPYTTDTRAPILVGATYWMMYLQYVMSGPIKVRVRQISLDKAVDCQAEVSRLIYRGNVGNNYRFFKNKENANRYYAKQVVENVKERTKETTEN